MTNLSIARLFTSCDNPFVKCFLAEVFKIWFHNSLDQETLDYHQALLEIP